MESIWITGKSFWKSNFLRLIRPETILKEFNLTTCKETEKVSEAGRMKTCHTSEDRQNQGTIPIPKFAPRPLTTSSYDPGGITAELHGRTAKTANIGIAIRQIP